MAKKKRNEPERKSNLQILPIRFYDESLDCFILDDKSYLDIMGVIPSDRRNLQGDAIEYNIINNMRFYRIYSGDLKFISLNFPVNTSFQRDILLRKIKKTGDEVRKLWLEREIEELERLDANVMRREYYMMFYGKTKDEFIKNKSSIINAIGYGRNKLVEEIEKEKKIQIVRKLCNLNSLLFSDELTEVSDEEE